MTTIFRVVSAIACMMFACAGTAAPTVRSLLKTPSNPSGTINGVPQEQSRLCWAATAQIAINTLAPPNPLMDQLHQVAYMVRGLDKPTNPLVDPQDVQLTGSQGMTDTQTVLNACAAVPGNCNRTGFPILVGLTRKVQTLALTRDQIVDEIGNHGRPFIFSWEYPESGSPRNPHGQHFLIAVGYDNTHPDPDGFLVEIWDPWPVPDPGHSKPGGNHTSITFTAYATPQLDMGLPTTYDDTRWQLTRFTRPNPPPGISVDGGSSSGGGQGPRNAESPVSPQRELSFATAIRQSLSRTQRNVVLERVRRQFKGSRAPLTIGVPFPIVALRIDQIVAEPNPEKLLRTKTSVVLYPVLAGGEVVDSFLMANRKGRWVETGYANTAVTSALVQVRKENARTNGVKPEDFFLLSVPEYSGFYASFRKGGKTVAIATSSDATLGTSWGKAQPAADVLRGIAAAAAKKVDVPAD